jgi:hypothetical protein
MACVVNVRQRLSSGCWIGTGGAASPESHAEKTLSADGCFAVAAPKQESRIVGYRLAVIAQ